MREMSKLSSSSFSVITRVSIELRYELPVIMKTPKKWRWTPSAGFTGGRLDPDRGDNVAGWLYRSTTNAAFNVVRARNRRLGWWRRLVRREGGIGSPKIQRMRRYDSKMSNEVRRALLDVPERQRDALLLRASGLSYAEIAEAIEVKAGSVGTLIARGERKLREIMTDDSESGPT